MRAPLLASVTSTVAASLVAQPAKSQSLTLSPQGCRGVGNRPSRRQSDKPHKEDSADKNRRKNEEGGPTQVAKLKPGLF